MVSISNSKYGSLNFIKLRSFTRCCAPTTQLILWKTKSRTVMWWGLRVNCPPSSSHLSSTLAGNETEAYVWNQIISLRFEHVYYFNYPYLQLVSHSWWLPLVENYTIFFLHTLSSGSIKDSKKIIILEEARSQRMKKKLNVYWAEWRRSVFLLFPSFFFLSRHILLEIGWHREMTLQSFCSSVYIGNIQNEDEITFNPGRFSSCAVD